MSSRFPWSHIVALAIWITISVAIYLYFDGRQKPTIAVAGAELASGEVVIPRSRDGHYYVKGAIKLPPAKPEVYCLSASKALVTHEPPEGGYSPNFIWS